MVLDKLTYAGNLENLARRRRPTRGYAFVQADIADRAAVRPRASPSTGRRRSSTSPPRRTSTARSTTRARSSRTNVTGTFELLEAARRHLRELAEAGKRFRFLHVSTDEVYGIAGRDGPLHARTTPYAPNSPYSARKAGADHLVRAYHETYGLPVLSRTARTTTARTSSPRS